MVSLAGSAARGAAATLLGQVARLAIQMGALVVLARLLSPSDFGLVAMVMAIVGIGELIRDFGLSNAAIQTRVLSEQQRINLFWISTSLGVAVAFVVAAASPLIAMLYDEPRLLAITLGLSTTFVLNGLSAQYRAGLARQLRFRDLAVVETAAPFVAAVVAIWFASSGFGYWSIVAQQVSQGIVGLVLVVLLGRWWPRRPRRTAGMRPLLVYGANLIGAQSVAYIGRNIDTVVMGLRFGPVPTGIYTRAFELIMNPLNQVNAPSSKVAIPILSRLQDDQDRYDRFLLRGQKVLLVAVTPVLALVVILATPVIGLILGDQWGDAVPFLQILAIAGLFRVAAYPTYWLALSRGYTGISLRVNLAATPIYAVAVLVGSLAGPIGVAWGFVAASGATWVIALIWYSRAADAPGVALFLNAARVILSNIPAALAAYALVWWLAGFALPYVTEIAIGCAGFILAFAATALIVRPVRLDLGEVVQIARMMRRRSQ